jgi:AraC family transcriptional regulator
MGSAKLHYVSEAMTLAGAPSLEVTNSANLVASGFFVEENYLPAADIPPVLCPCPSAGMVVSPNALPWHWRQSGRDRKALFHPENLCSSPQGEIPQQWWKEPVSIITIGFDPEFLSKSLAGFDSAKQVELRLSPTGQDPVICSLFWALRFELKSSWSTGPLVAETIAAALAAAVCRRFGTVPVAPPKWHGGLSRRALRNVTEFIHEHAAQPLGLKSLSQLAGLSPYHFCRQFKASTGISVHEYVVSTRIEIAKRLLLSTELPVGEVGYCSGMPNLSHFSTVFRKRVGVAPAAFRRQGKSY